ncbi:MAG: hypothetical protein M3Q42_05295 [Pseudomonadota bacterium]|nr:hypothetical protein [Pseudomonadota bacterium]
MLIGLWLATKAFIAGIPAAVWKWLIIGALVLAVAMLVQWRWSAYIASIDQAGYARAQAECQATQAEAIRLAAEQSAVRSTQSERIAATAAAQAQAATVEVRTDTAATVERVRTVTRTVQVPAGCPATLPVLAQDELHRMVEQANEANR